MNDTISPLLSLNSLPTNPPIVALNQISQLLSTLEQMIVSGVGRADLRPEASSVVRYSPRGSGLIVVGKMVMISHRDSKKTGRKETEKVTMTWESTGNL